MAAKPLMPATVPYSHPWLLLRSLLPCLLLLRLVLDKVIQLQDRGGMVSYAHQSWPFALCLQSPSACTALPQESPRGCEGAAAVARLAWDSGQGGLQPA